MRRIRSFSATFALLLTFILAAEANAQPAPAPRAVVPADAAPEGMADMFTMLEPGENTISVPGAQWLQLEFSAFELGSEGRLTVEAGDQRQDFTQEQMESRQGLTAIFNGSELIVTLTPGAGAAATARLGQVVIGLPTQGDGLESVGAVAPEELKDLFDGNLDRYIAIDEARFSRPPNVEAICGTNDNRTASTDLRVGRIMPIGCTGWIVQDGQILTAGHCIGAATQILQFNVPASQANGTPVAPGIADQYLIDRTSIIDDLTGVGNDWATFLSLTRGMTGLCNM
jgi:hypothetical protein